MVKNTNYCVGLDCSGAAAGSGDGAHGAGAEGGTSASGARGTEPAQHGFGISASSRFITAASTIASSLPWFTRAGLLGD